MGEGSEFRTPSWGNPLPWSLAHGLLIVVMLPTQAVSLQGAQTA